MTKQQVQQFNGLKSDILDSAPNAEERTKRHINILEILLCETAAKDANTLILALEALNEVIKEEGIQH